MIFITSYWPRAIVRIKISNMGHFRSTHLHLTLTPPIYADHYLYFSLAHNTNSNTGHLSVSELQSIMSQLPLSTWCCRMRFTMGCYQGSTSLYRESNLGLQCFHRKRRSKAYHGDHSAGIWFKTASIVL